VLVTLHVNGFNMHQESGISLGGYQGIMGCGMMEDDTQSLGGGKLELSPGLDLS